jgi:hypothetical protein
MVQLKQAKEIKDKKFDLDNGSSFLSRPFKTMTYNRNLGQFQQELKTLEDDLAMFRLQKNYNKNFNPVYYFGCILGSIVTLIYSLLTLIHM